MWDVSLRKAMEFETEVERSVSGSIKYNIGIIYAHHDTGNDEMIFTYMDEILEKVKPSQDTNQFSSSMRKRIVQWNYFLDAFYAKRPMNLELLQMIVLKTHKTIRKLINDYWNDNSGEMNAKEAIGFMGMVWFYQSIINFWGITDTRFDGWIEPLSRSFITKLYNSLKKLLASILYDLRNNYQNDGKLRSRSNDSISGHMNMIFEHYTQVQTPRAAEMFAAMAGQSFSIFLSNIRIFLREEKFPLQIYVALLNNTYIRITKAFIKQVHAATKNKLSIKQIKIIIDEDFLMITILEINRICLEKIKKFYRGHVKKNFFNKNKFLDYDFRVFLKKTLKHVILSVRFIEQNNIINEVIGEAFDQVVVCYYQLFLEHAPKINEFGFNEVIQKVKKDIKLFQSQLEEQEVFNGDQAMFKLNQLIEYLNSESIDSTLITIMNCMVFVPELHILENIDKFLQAKVFFPPESIKYIHNYFVKSFYSQKKVEKNKIKEKKGSLFSRFNPFKKSPANPYVFMFIRKLSKIIRTSCG